MIRLHLTAALLVLAQSCIAGLPFDTVFKGRAKFDALVAKADAWVGLPIGERTAAVGKAMAGTPYRYHTLEIDDRIEAPSANLLAMDCWTFFEQALAFARMLGEPREQWTPQTFLKCIELDRYRGGDCDGTYLSRLHYLEEWIVDNARRGLVQNLTGSLGGKRVKVVAREMTVNWRGYRYLKANPALRSGIRAMEERVEDIGMTMLPKGQVARIEGRLKNGDIICIATRDAGGYGTSHVGLAYRDGDGVLRFMHASAPRNHGKVVIDSRLSEYLNRFGSIAGIMVARPVK